MKTDVQIAQEYGMQPITELAEKWGIPSHFLEHYGKYKAKLNIPEGELRGPDGKLILVTAITPTPAGEGKTTTNIGLSMALNRIGKKAVSALREPSLGPNFGIKGGAAGGGYSQVVPMEDINLHFTGDMHAISAAHNLIAAMLDNHIHQGNSLGIDPRQVLWKRVVDLNDRALRDIVIGLGGKTGGVPRQDGFDITVASEIMAVLCLSTDLEDLKRRVGSILLAYTYDNKPVTVADIHAQGAVALLMKDAIHPNLVQTLEGTPALIHGGPFANIAHGCNSVTATKLGLKLADYVVTEAGFGADLGAEKFFNIKCRLAELKPDAAVVVATVRALKHHGGVPKEKWGEENSEALQKGFVNLKRHIENIHKFGVPVVVALNRFPDDTDKELAELVDACAAIGTVAVPCEVWAKGGAGGEELAHAVVEATKTPSNFRELYPSDLPLKEKIVAVATEIYRAGSVSFSKKATTQLERAESLGYTAMPVCMAKTQYSFSDDPNKLGAPEGFELTIRDVKVNAGAGFLVALTGDIMTMPGLPKIPAANHIDIDKDGTITGLF